MGCPAEALDRVLFQRSALLKGSIPWTLRVAHSCGAEGCGNCTQAAEQCPVWALRPPNAETFRLQALIDSSLRRDTVIKGYNCSVCGWKGDVPHETALDTVPERVAVYQIVRVVDGVRTDRPVVLSREVVVKSVTG